VDRSARQNSLGATVDADAGVRSVLNREAEVKSEAAPSVTEADVSRSAVSVSNASDLGPVAVSDSDTQGECDRW